MLARVPKAVQMTMYCRNLRTGRPMQNHFYMVARTAPADQGELNTAAFYFVRTLVRRYRDVMSSDVGVYRVAGRDFTEGSSTFAEFLFDPPLLGLDTYPILPSAMSAVWTFHAPGYIGRASRNRIYTVGMTTASYIDYPAPGCSPTYIGTLGAAWNNLATILATYIEWSWGVYSNVERRILPIGYNDWKLGASLGGINRRRRL